MGGVHLHTYVRNAFANLSVSVNCPSRISQGDHLELAFNEFLILAELVSVHKFGLRHRPAPFT